MSTKITFAALPLSFAVASLLVSSPRATFAQEASTAGSVYAEDDDLSVVGVMVDAGVPDGVTASLVVRPFWWLRAHAGVGHNLMSNSLRGGVSLIPLDTWITLTLTAEAGHYVSGDANELARRFAPDFPGSVALSSVSYTFANAHGGLELGQEYMTLYAHAGMTYLDATFGTGTDEIDGTSVELRGAPRLSGWVPSAKVGLIVYLF